MTPTLDAAIADLARLAAEETATDAAAVGALESVEVGEDGYTTVRFACELKGYRGWSWTVVLAVLDGESSVCESYLLPGDDALLAAPWIPWSDRVRPGDLEPTMVLPYIAEDPRLVPGYTDAIGDDMDAMELFEFGLGRERVLAPEGREAAAERWHRGSHGPTAASAVASAAPCSTCAFFIPLSGSMRLAFGACANEWSPSDGRVVSVDHGCGAHSQTDAERRASEWPAPDPIIDSGAIDPIDLDAVDPEPESVVEQTDAATIDSEADGEAGEQAANAADVDVDAADAEAEAPSKVADAAPADEDSVDETIGIPVVAQVVEVAEESASVDDGPDAEPDTDSH